MFFKKEKVNFTTYSDFMEMKESNARRAAGHDPVVIHPSMDKTTRLSLAAAAAVAIASPLKAHASTGEIIMRAFDPIIDLLQGISYPVAFIMISGGFLLVMTGQKHRGMDFIKWACLGYIGLQFAPALMKIVVSIGENIQSEVNATP